MEKILLVDDEPNVLEALRRCLHKKFELATAVNGEQALELVRESGPFAVVVSDMRMPGMNGAELLLRVRQESPQSIRMILSGHSDIDAAIDAVNRGEVFRFLTKPWELQALVASLETAIEQHRLVAAERELLEKTLNGAVQVLTEVLSIVDPDSFARTSRVTVYAEALAKHLAVEKPWQVRLAALLSQIGFISLPPLARSQAWSSAEADDAARKMFNDHPHVAARMISGIPRLEEVAKMVAGQLDAVDLTALPGDLRSWEPTILGAQILRASIAFDRWICTGLTQEETLVRMAAPVERYAPGLLETLAHVPLAQSATAPRALRVDQLRPHMVLDEDVLTTGGLIIVRRGETITFPMLARLKNFAEGVGIHQPFRVLVPTVGSRTEPAAAGRPN